MRVRQANSGGSASHSGVGRHITSGRIWVATVFIGAAMLSGLTPAAANATTGASPFASNWLATACSGLPAPTIHDDATSGGISVQPPEGFNPLSASAEQLSCYGYPPRPSAQPALQAWQSDIGRASTYVVPTPNTTVHVDTPSTISKTWYVCENGYGGCNTHTTGKQAPWAGYAAWSGYNTQYSNLQWTNAEAAFTVPQGHTYCYNAQVDVWDGIGGDGWDDGTYEPTFLQDGTITINSSPTPKVEWFWLTNVSINGDFVTFTTPNVAAGDYVVVYTNYNSNNTATFSFFDDTTGEGTNYVEPIPSGLSRTSTEYIVENQPSPDYVNFGSVEFNEASSAGTYGNNQQTSGYVTQYNLTKFVTYNWNIPPNGGSVGYPVDLPYGYFKVVSANATC